MAQLDFSMAETFAQRYADVSVQSSRTVLRHTALSLVSSLYNQLPILERVLATPRVHFLYMHYVFQDEEKPFEAFLRWLLASGHTPISYSDAVQKVAYGEIDKPYVCFSYDDGVDNCVQAAKILKQYGFSACFFLNTSTIGKERQLHKMLMTANCYARLPVRYLSWVDVEALKESGHEIGGHTHSHVNMGQLARTELEEEVGLNKELLEQRCGKIEHFAWPFGRFHHFSTTARDVVFEAGYYSCASAERGAHIVPAKDNRFCIHRDTVVAAWPLDHLKYLLARSTAKSTPNINLWSVYGEGK